jgi:hypothetical protein
MAFLTLPKVPLPMVFLDVRIKVLENITVEL